MNHPFSIQAALVVLTLVFAPTTIFAADESNPSTAEPVYRYLLEGTATPEVFAALMASPEDRAVNARGLMEAAGCKLIDYYIGINNYKSYIIIECGDPADLNALQMVMYASGAIIEGTATRLVTSAELVGVMQDAGGLVESYGIPEK